MADTVRVASDFTEGELIPLSVRFIMCALQQIVDLVFFFHFLFGDEGG